MSRHLSDDQLMDRLYGVHLEGSAHLDACPECAARWALIEQRRRGILAAQQSREAEWPVRVALPWGPAAGGRLWRPTWVPLLALAGVVLAAAVWLNLTGAAPPPAPPAASAVEAGWFEDAYSVMQPVEPRAATPIRVLFQEEAVTE